MIQMCECDYGSTSVEGWQRGQLNSSDRVGCNLPNTAPARSGLKGSLGVLLRCERDTHTATDP